MMIALLIHGIRPGPLLMTEQPEVFWGLIASMYIGNVVLVILNLPLVGIFVSLLRVPFRILFPLILLICMVGTYSMEENTFQLWVLLGFGVLGYGISKLEFDIAPLILAMVLGNMTELEFRRTLMLSGGSLSILYKSPITLLILVLSLTLLLWNIYRALRPNKAEWEKALEESE
jgi:putative tricarboxylic transport membrane protein